MTEITIKPVPQVLREAATIMNTGGLCQGDLRQAGGQHCTVGALADAVGHGKSSLSPDVFPAIVAVDIQLGNSGELDRDPWDSWDRVTEWNDTDGRTKQEVVDILLAAADRLDGKTKEA